MNDFLKEIGRSYIVSSLLPAALFLPLGFIAFYDLIPPILFQRATELSVLWGQNWFLFSILIFWVGFLLYSSFQSIIEIYIGNWLPKRIKQKMQSRCGKYYSKLLKSYYLACEVINNISERDNGRNLSELRPLALAELGRLGLSVPIPLQSENISQTRIGNVFQSSAVYINDRYNINGRVMWPRLVHVFPSSFLKNLEEKNNYFLFLLNSSFLAGILGIIGLLSGIIRIMSRFIEKYQHPWTIITYDASINFILTGVGFFVCSYVFYRLATNAAEEYSQIVCSGFDLYRCDLLSQMGILPKKNDFLYEKQFWGILCEYMVAGNTLGKKEINFIIDRSKAKDKKEIQEAKE